MLALRESIPATERFDRHTVYTLRRGPNAGRALKYVGPGVYPFQDHVHVVTADGLPFSAKTGAHEGRRSAVCKPEDLVPK
jgi:hypothetical protein